MTVALAISPTSGLVFHSAILGGMNGRRFDDLLAQTRLNLDPDEHVIFIYDAVRQPTGILPFPDLIQNSENCHLTVPFSILLKKLLVP